jgi:hypothetical protein
MHEGASQRQSNSTERQQQISKHPASHQPSSQASRQAASSDVASQTPTSRRQLPPQQTSQPNKPNKPGTTQSTFVLLVTHLFTHSSIIHIHSFTIIHSQSFSSLRFNQASFVS